MAEAPITLCVLLTAVAGQEDALADYEDQVLELLGAHGGRVISRLSVIDGPPTEVQVLEFASEQGVQSFQDDPARLRLAGLRERAIAATTVLKGKPLPPGS
jgi:uncharacterized protein (DUF1330 family)